MTAAPAPGARTRGDLVRTLVRGLGQTLITVGVVLLLFVVYTLWITNLFTARDQAALDDQITRQWEAPAAPGDVPGFGEAYARIYIPAVGLGMDTRAVVVQGVSVADLKRGAGHMPSTQAPGEVGNTVISGHRTTYGAPFADLGELEVGDEVVLETRDSWFVYAVTGAEVVRPSAIEVTYPVPGQPGAVPTQRLLTLTTCNPKYSAKQRLVVRGELVSTVPKAGGQRPPALASV